MERKIGVIDSGVGGLTVAKEIIKELPRESLIYFGDTARCPYGNKAVNEIKTYVYEMVEFLMKKNIKALVLACNTATALMIEELRVNLSIPVIGVIEPGALAANKKTKTNAIGVIATTRTIESRVYEQNIKRLNAQALVISRACPLLVPLIEQNEMDTMKSKELIEASLYPLKAEHIDTLVLGCTHYPIISKQISDYFNGEVALVDPAQETAKELGRVLKVLNIQSQSNRVGHEYYVSGDVESFNRTARTWCGRVIYAERHTFASVKS